MKTKEHYLILAFVTAILCVPVLGNVDFPLLTNRPVSLGHANPALAGIQDLYVLIVAPDSEPNKDSLIWKNLQVRVEQKLLKTDIRLAHVAKHGRISRSFDIPELRVDIDMLKLEDLQRYVFRIQTSLATKLYLAKDSKLTLKADVWKKSSTMQVVSVENMPAAVTNVVLKQVDTFVNAYFVANKAYPPHKPKGAQAADANDITVVTAPKSAKPVAKPAVAKYKFVASKNSKVFHKPECSWAKRISPKNLVTYSTRDKAIEAGKRPCKFCKP